MSLQQAGAQWQPIPMKGTARVGKEDSALHVRLWKCQQGVHTLLIHCDSHIAMSTNTLT